MQRPIEWFRHTVIATVPVAMAERVLEVALFHAVDGGLLEHVGGPVDPAGAPGEVADEAEHLREAQVKASAGLRADIDALDRQGRLDALLRGEG